jgi:hypothetical protein
MIKTSVVQHGSSAESTVLEVGQCAWRITHWIPDGCRAYAKSLGQPEERLPVRAGIRGH